MAQMWKFVKPGVPSQLRHEVSAAELAKRNADITAKISANRTCMLIDKHGINSVELCAELRIEPSRLPAWLMGNEKAMMDNRHVRLPKKYTIVALEKLPQDMYAAKVKDTRLQLGQYSKAVKALANITGDRYPKPQDTSLAAEKFRVEMSQIDYQSLAISQLRNPPLELTVADRWEIQKAVDLVCKPA